MRIGVFGATGVIGSRIVHEAVTRGHEVTAISRSTIPTKPGPVTWRQAEISDPAAVTELLPGLDVLVNAINAGRDIDETIRNANALPTAARSLLRALESHPRTRLIVIGGAGSLEVSPGQQIADLDGIAESLPTDLGTPPEYLQVIRAHRAALNLYRLSNRDWTYLSPSALLIPPGERTGRYRLGRNQLLVRADGTSAISAEDLAVAVLDEVEHPRHVGLRFTVGY
ncbi:NAD(P)-dependent oxidoreductase [Crossiella cryophila]|uniref:Putative NADH-flavin reductase n=1 Tax=Crossiella cryophila TaxID=43355 RepID=A0A7W7FXG5_9PSEU|nr:NAD(P)H-binding protein [Crossiella cryophila]MBB4678909.1 putative NADH-flavin reductase [Crossiella cryophila]